MGLSHTINSHRTLCALPNELLHEIVTAVGNSLWIKACTLVCSCLRPVCQEVLFKRQRYLCIWEDRSFVHVLSFINSLNISLNIVRLKLDSGEGALSTIDAAFVARIVKKLPQLRALSIYACIKATNASPTSSEPPTPTSSLIAQPSRRTLEDLTIFTWNKHQSSLAEALRIAALFEVDTLRIGGSYDLATAPTRSRVSLPLRARFLVAEITYSSQAHETEMLSALALHLETGYLQQLHVKISCRDSIRVLGGLLAGPASQIVELKIDNPSLYIIEDEEHQDWNDLLDQHWSLLNLSACTRLENLSLNVAMPLKAAAFPLCAAPAKLIQQVSKTLKKVTFYVDVITMPEALSNRRLTKLQALDKVLSDPAKLPRFESLELHLRLCPITLVDRDRFRAKAIAGCKKALRNLHASERLTIEASINDIVLISSTEGGSI